MKGRILLAFFLATVACSLWAWGVQHLSINPQYRISIGTKTMEAAEVEIGSRSCIIVTRGDAIAIDCD